MKKSYLLFCVMTVMLLSFVSAWEDDNPDHNTEYANTASKWYYCVDNNIYWSDGNVEVLKQQCGSKYDCLTSSRYTYCGMQEQSWNPADCEHELGYYFCKNGDVYRDYCGMHVLDDECKNNDCKIVSRDYQGTGEPLVECSDTEYSTFFCGKKNLIGVWSCREDVGHACLGDEQTFGNMDDCEKYADYTGSHWCRSVDTSVCRETVWECTDGETEYADELSCVSNMGVNSVSFLGIDLKWWLIGIGVLIGLFFLTKIVPSLFRFKSVSIIVLIIVIGVIALFFFNVGTGTIHVFAGSPTKQGDNYICYQSSVTEHQPEGYAFVFTRYSPGGSSSYGSCYMSYTALCESGGSVSDSGLSFSSGYDNCQDSLPCEVSGLSDIKVVYAAGSGASSYYDECFGVAGTGGGVATGGASTSEKTVKTAIGKVTTEAQSIAAFFADIVRQFFALFGVTI